VVKGDEIVVTSAADRGCPNQPQFIVRGRTDTDDHEVLAQDWQPVGIDLYLLSTFLNKLPLPFTEAKLVVAVILFGAVGAAVSGSQGVLVTEVLAKIPAQQVGSFAVGGCGQTKI
jgi:hypothetical protein